MNRTVIIVAGVLALAAFFYFINSNGRQTTGRDVGKPIITSIEIPALSNVAKLGATLFKENCQECHGENATGKEGFGPPLIHKIYEPSHHGDQSFYFAPQRGVRQHHWSFGNMPPISGVNNDDVTNIIQYIREIQRANGIN